MSINQHHSGQGHNIARDFIDQTKKYIIQLKGKSIQEILWLLVAVLISVLVFLLCPGILIASLVNNFLNITSGQAWGTSIVGSIGVFLILFFTSRNDSNVAWNLNLAGKRYLFASIYCALMMMLGHLFSPNIATMPHLVVAKMFVLEKDINKEIVLHQHIFKTFDGETLLAKVMSFFRYSSIVGQWKDGKEVFLFEEENHYCRYYLLGALKNDTSYGVWSKKSRTELAIEYSKKDTETTTVVIYKIEKLSKDSLILIGKEDNLRHTFSK